MKARFLAYSLIIALVFAICEKGYACPVCDPPISPILVSPPDGEPSVSASGTTLDWSDVECDSYRVYMSCTDSTPDGDDLVASPTNSYWPTGPLEPGVMYYWCVRAYKNCDGGTFSPYSETWDFTTDGVPDTTPPSPNPMTWVPGLEPHASGSTAISMTATTASDPRGVEYYFENVTITGHDSGWQDSPSYEDTGLSPGTDYIYRVKARDKSCSLNEGDWSIDKTATTIPLPPAAPSGLTASAASGLPSWIKLSWTDNSSNEIGFKIQRKTGAGGTWAQIGTVETGVTYYDVGLDSSLIYYYRVCAYNAGGDSFWSDEASESPCPAAPTGLIATAGEQSVTLDWSDNTELDMAGYNVYRSENQGGPYNIVDSLVSESNYPDGSLINGTTYYYVVTAVDDDSTPAESSYSNEASATPQDLPPAAPGTLTADFNTATGKIDLDWPDNGETDLGGYRVYCSLSPGGGPYANIGTTIAPVSGYNDDVSSSWAAGRTYYYVVTAFDDPGGNESGYSNEAFDSVTYKVHNLNRDKWYYFVQTAINEAWYGETIEVSQGTYRENIQFTDQKITLTSVDATDPTSTVINGNAARSVIAFDLGDAASVIMGLTITNGSAAEGAGVYCNGASPTITGCVISGNDASNNGGGLYISDGSVTLIETVFKDNHANSGGAIYGNSGASVSIKDCNLGQAAQGNTATQGGGALSGCSGSIQNSIIAHNSGGSGAGAISNSTVEILNSVIMENTGCDTEGSGLATALDNCDGDIVNCTIVSNLGGTGITCSGLINCGGQIKNCIIWGNGDGTTDQLENCSTPAYCCIQDYSGAGSNGNINSAPSFDADGYHLTPSSPCIDAGDPNNPPADDETDIDGDWRLRATSVDMGAHEYGKVIYVDNSIGTSGNGLSWDTPYKYLRDALNSTVTQLDAGDEIWVADGTYYPDEDTANSDGTDDRNATFQLVEKVAMYGGFAGGEDHIYERNLEQNITILSGDIDAEDWPPPEGETIYTGNSYHVVTGSDKSLLDGFTITEGYVEEASIPGGSGVYCVDTSPIIRNCAVTNNFAKYGRNGGGMYISGSASPTLVNCLIAGNFANHNYCGGIYHIGDTLELINCTIVDNASDGIHCDGATLNIDNSIIWHNRLDPQDQVEFPVREIVLNNAQVDIYYSNVEKGQAGITISGNTTLNTDLPADNTLDPGFADWGNWQWQLANGTAVQQGTTFEAKADEITIYDLKKQFADVDLGMDHHEDDFIQDMLDTNSLSPTYKKPIWQPDPGDTSTVSNVDNFNLWFSDDPDPDKGSPIQTNQNVPSWICVDKDKGVFRLDSEHFFPIDDWCDDPNYGCGGDPDCMEFCKSLQEFTCEYEDHCTDHPGSFSCDYASCSDKHNYFFTLQYHTKFRYIPGQNLRFISSDDLFLAIDNAVVVNRAGFFVDCPSDTEILLEDGDAYVYRHNYQECDVDASEKIFDLNLQPYEEYDLDIFFAQRRRPLSVLVTDRTPGDSEIVAYFEPGDYHLTSGSPCIDAGDDDAVPVNVETDLDGIPRFIDDPDTNDTGAPPEDAPYVDMGAYEYDAYIYEPIWAYAGEAKSTRLPKDTVTLWDAQVGGGYEELTTVKWSALHVPLDCQVDFDPATVAIETTSTEPNPTVKFVVENENIFQTVDFVTFKLQLEATDTFTSASDEVSVTVYPGAVQNKPPYVDAGIYDPINVGDTLHLINAEVHDDGLPRGYLEHRWEVVLYPTDPIGDWEFDSEFDRETVQAKITFYQPTPAGEPYRLMLWADDGKERTESYTEVTVTGTANNPPTVDAGDGHTNDSDGGIAESITLNNVDLGSGGYVLDLGSDLTTVPSSIDDGRLEPLTYLWTVQGRADGARFSSRTELQPTVTFTRAGTYILTLTADDGQFTANDTLTVVINPAPEAYAGENKPRTVADPCVTVELDDAWGRDNTLPDGLNYEWQVLDKPTNATVAFKDPGANQQNPTVYISGPSVNDIKGSYKLELTVTDVSTGLQDTDEVYIIVEPDVSVQPPTKKSLYAITKHSVPPYVRAYEIDDYNLVFEKIVDQSAFGYGPVAIAVSDAWDKVFITYEEDDAVVVVSALKMDWVCDVHTGVNNQAGIVADDNKEKLYVIERYTNRLYVYTWDEKNKTLIPEGSYRELANVGSGHGLAMDEDEGLLYVTDESSTVHFYDTSNWNHQGSVDVCVNGTDYTAVGIAFDSVNKLLYTGHWYGHDYLVKTDLGNRSKDIALNVGQPVIGLAVDQATSLVYCTSYWDDIRVFDSSLDLKYTHVPENGETGPAGLAVGLEVAYKYPIGSISKSKVAGPATASPSDQVTYEITYTIQYEANDPSGDSIDTYVTDILPVSLDFVSASHQGVYDSNGRKVTWYLGDVPEGQNNSSDPFVLKVMVNDYAKPGGVIVNKCEIESNARYASTEAPDVNVGWWAQTYEVIYVDQKARGGSGISWDKAYRYLEDAIAHANNISAVGEIWVAGGPRSYSPGVDSGDTFQMVNGVSIYGGFSGTESSIDERDLTDPANETVLTGSGQVDYVVTGADNAVLDGFTISEGVRAGVLCDGNSPTIAYCVIQYNQFPYPSGVDWGDGIHCVNGASPTITNNIIRYNDQGITYMDSSAPVIKNNWICDSTYWGGIFFNGTTAQALIHNNTIVNNVSGGIERGWSNGMFPEIINCILWDNGTGTGGHGNLHDYVTLPVNFTLNYCCINSGEESEYDGADNTTADPHLVAPASGDYHLAPDSPCINTGDPSYTPGADETDIDGEVRIVGTQIDIGADEHPPIVVYAGKDQIKVLSLTTGKAEVTFDDADLTSMDETINTSQLTVQWSCEYKPSGANVDWNGQQNVLKPTFIFSEPGIYVLKLSAFEDIVEKGSDLVVVQIEVGLELTYTPDDPEFPGATVSVTDYNAGSATIDHIKWQGPEGVTFTPQQTPWSSWPNVSTDITVEEPARYQIWAVAYGPGSTYLGAQDIWVPINPQGIKVTIVAEPETITWPNKKVNLSAIVEGGNANSFTWIKPEGAENLVHFGGANDEGIHHPQTYVEFDNWGSYEIGLEVKDEWNYPVGFAKKTIVVEPPDFTSIVVRAGKDQTIPVEQHSVTLSGSVEGAGDLVLTYRWLPPVDSSGSPVASIETLGGDPLSAIATFSNPAPGDYTFGLVAMYDFGNGPEPVALDDVTITVEGPGTPYEAPVTVSIVDVNGDGTGSVFGHESITLHLRGTITDSLGLVDQTMNEWICYSSQGSVSFDIFSPVRNGNTITQEVDVTFSAIDIYRIGLIAKKSDGSELATAVITITITSKEFSVSVDAEPSSITLFDGQTVALTAQTDATEADWTEWVDDTGTIEFSNITYDSNETSLTSTATAKFNAAGTFYPRFVLKVGGANGTVIAAGSTQVTVGFPDILVTALAGPDAVSVAEGPYAIVFNNSDVNVYLDCDHTPLSGTLSYQWDCIEWPAAATQPNPADSQQSSVTLSVEGTYVFQVTVKVDSNPASVGQITVELLTGQPVVSAGWGYPIFKTNEWIHLDKAYVLDDTAIVPGNINWSSIPTTGVSWDLSQDREKPKVKFTNAESYDLTIDYNDGQYPTVSNTVTVHVVESVYVHAGDPQTAIPFETISLDAWTDPPYNNLIYKWTATSASGLGTATFINPGSSPLPGDSILQPDVMFDMDDTYTLTLTVSFCFVQGQPPVELGSGEVEVVVTTPDWLKEAIPPTITSAKINGTAFSSFTGPVCDYLEIEVEAEDEHLESIYLELDGTVLTADKFLTYETAVLEGLPDAPRKMRLTATLDTHSMLAGTARSLKAWATDRAGNTSDITTNFDTDCIIYDFAVDPNTATTLQPVLTFSAQFESSQNWNLDIFEADDGSMTTPVKNRSGTSSIAISETIDFSDVANGSYKARLNVPDNASPTDTAYVYFDVAIGSVSSGLEAEIDESLKVEYDDLYVPLGSKPEITTGKYTLQGKAYHSSFSNVDYKIVISNSEGLSCNITPSLSSGSEYVTGSVGDSGGYGSFGELDLTTLENGPYTIALIVNCHGETKSDSVDVVLNCPLKLGNVKFSQEDMAITVGGIPLTVIRTYDSFKKDQYSDFGYGWSYSLANMNIQLNERRMPYWGVSYKVRDGGEFDRDVTVTLPTGEQATFRAKLEGSASSGYTLSYNKLSNTNYSLSVNASVYVEYQPPEYSGKGMWWVIGGRRYDPVDRGIAVDMSLHDFPGFTLTGDDGIQYVFNRHDYGETEVPATGNLVGWNYLYTFETYGKPYLESIKLANDEEIRFVVDHDTDPENPRTTDVQHYLADGTLTKSIQIVRNPDSGRIEQIWAPKDISTGLPSLQYDYYNDGRLWKVHKLVDREAAEFEGQYETTTYEYSGRLITKILDPRGLAPIQYIYDETGKLIATIDAKGNRIELAHALKDGGDTYEEVTDRNKNKTRYYYNDRGNVVRVERYDKDGVFQDKIEYVYPSEGSSYPDNPIKIIRQVPDPADPSALVNAVTENRYDSYGRLALTIEPELNATETHYDSTGNVTKVIQWRPDGASPAFPAGYPAWGTPTDYAEVSTTENVYNSDDLRIFTGVRNGSYWYSMTLNYYLSKNRLTDTVQVNLDHVTSKADVFAVMDEELVAITSIPGYPDHVITRYTYDNVASGSHDQPYSITDPVGLTRYFKYDKNNNQLYSYYLWVDPAGEAADMYVFSVNYYDSQGRVIETSRMTDDDADPFNTPDSTPATEVILSSTVYNSIGKVAETIDEHGNYTQYDYDELGNLAEARTYDSGQNLLITAQTLYDAEGRVLVTVGPYAAGDQPVGTETVYDALGRVVETRRWENVTINLIDLVVNSKIVGKTVNVDPDAGIIIANAWDGAGTQPTSIGWTSNGDLPVAKSTVAAGQIGPLSYSRTIYDVGGRVKHSISLQEAEWNSSEWVAQEQPTTYYYDKAGKQTIVIDPLGHDISNLTTEDIALYGYTPYEPVIAKWTDFSNFDDTEVTGNLTGTHKTETLYEGTRCSAVTDALGNTTSFEYDALGRLLTTTHPDAVLHNTGSTAVTTYTYVEYDGLGRKAWQSAQTRQTDRNHTDSWTDAKDFRLRKRDFEYDTAGRLIATLLPEPEQDAGIPRYDYFYDDYGNQIAILDPLVRMTVFKYDHLNKQTARYMPFVVDPATITDTASVYAALAAASPAPNSEERSYDDLSRLEMIKDYKGQITGFEYNNRGQLQYKKYYVDQTAYDAQNPSETIEYTYDNLGRKYQITEARGTTTYYYNDEGRVYQVDTPEGTINYDYDDITSRKVATDSTNTATDYFYDGLGRLAQVSTGSETAIYGYDEVGNRDWMELDLDTTPDFEIKTDYTYDQLNRLTELIQQKAGPAQLASYFYKVYADGMRQNLNETVNEAHDITYTYDNLNRITKESANPTGDGYEIDYTYDLAGNRTERVVKTISGGATAQTLTTTYNYYTGTDRLQTEVHVGPTSAFIFGNERYYAYANTGKGLYYRDSNGNKIGSVHAFFIGLPSVWSRYMFILAMALVPVLLFGPGLLRLIGRLIFGRAVRIRLRVPRKGICLLVAFVMLLGPQSFHSLSEAARQYSELSTTHWAEGGETIHYQYDDNGSLTKKIRALTGEADPENNYIEKYEYDYNLANRLETVTHYSYEDIDIDTNDDHVKTVTTYTYNDDGIRVAADYERSVDYYPLEGTFELYDQRSTTYLVGPFNHTGYAQTLEESTDITYEEGSPVSTSQLTTYLIGDDVIAQTKDGTTQYLLYDGHGSTRQLADYDSGTDTVTIADTYSYDAYGVMLGGNPEPTSPAGTNLLYAGEHFDTTLQHYYLRARWYNPSTGLFNRVDPFPGNQYDPQSLHKYLYCHANPINGVDPGGMQLTLSLNVNLLITIAVMMVAVVQMTQAIQGQMTLGIAIVEFLQQVYAGAMELGRIIGEEAEFAVLSVIPTVVRLADEVRGKSREIRRRWSSGNYDLCVQTFTQLGPPTRGRWKHLGRWLSIQWAGGPGGRLAGLCLSNRATREWKPRFWEDEFVIFRLDYHPYPRHTASTFVLHWHSHLWPGHHEILRWPRGSI